MWIFCFNCYQHSIPHGAPTHLSRLQQDFPAHQGWICTGDAETGMCFTGCTVAEAGIPSCRGAAAAVGQAGPQPWAGCPRQCHSTATVMLSQTFGWVFPSCPGAVFHAVVRPHLVLFRMEYKEENLKSGTYFPSDNLYSSFSIPPLISLDSLAVA